MASPFEKNPTTTPEPEAPIVPKVEAEVALEAEPQRDIEQIKKDEKTQGSIVPWEELEAFDEGWFEEYLEIEKSLPSSLTTLEGDPQTNLAQRKAFESGEIQNPQFTYKNVDPNLYQAAEEAMLKLKERVIREMHGQGEAKEIAGRLYIAKINEQIASYRLTKAVAEGDTRAVQRYATFTYGRPQLETFVFMVDNLRRKIRSSFDPTNPRLNQAALELTEMLEAFPESEFSEVRNAIKQKELKNLARKELNDVFKIRSEYVQGQVFTAEEVVKIFGEALSHLDDPEWEVVFVDGTDAKADAKFKEVRIGRDTTVRGQRLQTLLMHEVGTHAKRSIRGGGTRLKLLSLGLDRYLDNEEGVASVKEGSVYAVDAGDEVSAKDEFPGVASYIATSLARGFYTEVPDESRPGEGKLKRRELVSPRDFRQTYEFYYKYQKFLASHDKNRSDQDIEKQAKNYAWSRARRLYRGFTGQERGNVFPKELTYAVGALSVHTVVNKSRNLVRTYELLGDVGKYDVSNVRHFQALVKMGIITLREKAANEDDLEALLEAA
jgi:hypothetical protein